MDRKSIKPMKMLMRNTFTDENVGELLGDSETWKDFAKRQTNFFQFAKTFLNQDWNPEKHWLVEFPLIKGMPLAILCLNSAWACQDNHDKENILLGEFQVHHALKSAEKAPLPIALFHHPFSHLKPFDAESVEGSLAASGGSHFLLRGHLHKNKLHLQQRPDSKVFEFAAGACWESPNSTQGAMAVKLNVKTGQGTVKTWSYFPDDGGYWTEGRYKGLKNGEWAFDIPPEWKLSKAQSKPAGFSGSLIPPTWRAHLVDSYGGMNLCFPKILRQVHIFWVPLAIPIFRQ